MFKEYKSKPVIRRAFQISVGDTVSKTSTEAQYFHQEADVSFKAYEEPQAGDWIVRLTLEDTYHVSDVVFRERNIVD